MMTLNTDLTSKLKDLQARAEKARTEKARAEATLESLEKQREELLTEIGNQGIEPDQLESEIQRLEKEIAGGLARAEELLPKGDGGQG